VVGGRGLRRRDDGTLNIEAFGLQELGHPSVQSVVGDRRCDRIAVALLPGGAHGQFAGQGLFRFHPGLAAVMDIVLDAGVELPFQSIDVLGAEGGCRVDADAAAKQQIRARRSRVRLGGPGGDRTLLDIRTPSIWA